MRPLRLVLAIVLVAMPTACGSEVPEDDQFAALIPQLDGALSVISQALVCPGSEVVEEEFDPLEVGSLEEHGQRLPDRIALDASLSLVQAGERVRVAIWNDANARPVALQVMWEFDDGDYGLRRVRWCGS